MTTPGGNLSTAPEELSSTSTVVIAWRTGKNAHGRVVKSGGEVVADLRKYATETLGKIAESQGGTYDPNDEKNDDDYYLEAPTDELLDTALIHEIRKGASLDKASKEDLRRPLALYALVVGDDPENLTVFVKRGTPIALARKNLVAQLVDDSLTKVQDALFAFENKYDVVIYPDKVHILNQQNFEALFKESEAVLAKTDEWVAKLADALPMSSGSSERLSTRMRSNSLMRRQIQSILRSDYLASLTSETLRDKMTERGLDPDELLDEEGLIFTGDTEKPLLQLLNEDLWSGDFSGRQYAASRKARRS